MKDKMTSFTLKMALFLAIASGIMLIICEFGSAEWYISLFTCGLMLLLVVIIAVMIRISNRRQK